jgi:Sulfotransferase family
MLGEHPDLVGVPELKLFLYPTLGDLDASLPAAMRRRGFTHRSPGLVRAIAQFVFGDQSTAAVTEALAWLHKRAHWTGAEVLDFLLAKSYPRSIVEKSPENAMADAALGRLAAAYPRARYLHLVRHPTSTARSMEAHWAERMPSQPLPDPEVTCHAAWYLTHRRIVRFTSALPRERCLRLRAEDVLNDTEQQLSAIARWLGIRYDAVAIDAMRHPECSPFARFGPEGSGVTGGNDPGFLADPIPRLAELPVWIERPSGWNGGKELWASVTRLAAELGYTNGDWRRRDRRHRHRPAAHPR